ncbi:MAG: hypothetical protein HS101_15420 [Planctomycetia bacterium]|jgi:hypothetical protein|nr:hypothetical protein [Planctomycetia bacterium]MCC7316863.1 hypothetical protein [Planctomycetota bacterium]OQZ01887.1 MAG: hypothetical protein B6D36_13670 [Planctomycetes bacterium UTPLA1]
MALIDIDWKPSAKLLRSFGLIGLFAFAVVAGIVEWKHKIVIFPIAESAVPMTRNILLGLAGYCGVFAMIMPQALLPVYLFLTAVGYPIGLVVSFAVMLIMYFLVITPIGVAMRLLGRDPMRRKFDPAAQSYWIRRTPPADIRRYYRQF